jgi:exonuclease VII small subunit
MNNQPRIPDAETRARSVANLRQLVKRMDAGILELDELIARLEADIRNSPLTAYRLGKAKRTITPQTESK